MSRRRFVSKGIRGLQIKDFCYATVSGGEDFCYATVSGRKKFVSKAMLTERGVRAVSPGEDLSVYGQMLIWGYVTVYGVMLLFMGLCGCFLAYVAIAT